METLITSGVEVKVETVFHPEQSSFLTNQFVFAYHITVANHNNFTVQLLHRRWKITDSNFDKKFVAGEGVVGRQPVLYPGDSFNYVSACNISSPIGKMEGIYIFENKLTRTEFEVRIPVFKLVAPVILN